MSESGFNLMMADERDLLVASTPRAAMPRAYGFFTRIVRVLLVLAMGGTIAVIFMWPREEIPMAPAPTAQTSSGSTGPLAQTSNDLVAPKFSSTDENGNPFTLTASRAVQVAGKPDLIDLDGPSGSIKLSSNLEITVRAPSGLYDQNAKTLDLSGGVVVSTNDGYTVTTDHIRLDMAAQRLVAETPVTGNGPEGEITGQSLLMDGTQNILMLNGPATLVLNKGI